MEQKLLFPDTVLKRTGGNVTAERTTRLEKNLGWKREDGYVVSYTLRGGGKGMDVNDLVYELLILAAQDVLDVSVTFGGEYTASELAGKVGVIPRVMTFGGTADYEAWKVVELVTPTYKCRVAADDIFKYMAEWEGVMSLPAKKQHRFCCEGKELPKGMDTTTYKRNRVYGGWKISLAEVHRRLVGETEVIGRMAEALGSEGMKRALSVLTAIESIGKLYDYKMKDLAGKLLRRKLWMDYGHCDLLKRQEACLKSEMDNMAWKGNSKSDRYKKMEAELGEIRKRIATAPGPMTYSAEDFQYGPEAWKVVDDAYVTELMAYFEHVLAENKKPKWPKKDDLVQRKNQNTTPKKWQGKLKVCDVHGSLDLYKDKINWYAEVCTTKGKWESTTCDTEWLVPFVEPVSAKGTQQEQGKKTKAAAKSSLEKAVDRALDIEMKHYDRMIDYIAEHYPTQSVCSAATTSPQGRKEREAMKHDPVMAEMRQQADEEYNAADKEVRQALKDGHDAKPSTISPQPSLSDRLRAALRKQLAIAA